MRLDHATFGGDVAVLTTALERVFDTGPGQLRTPPLDWNEDQFGMLVRDPRPSSQRMVAIIDVLAARPETALSCTDLGEASGLSRGELMGALSGFTRVRKLLWPVASLPSPIMISFGPSGPPRAVGGDVLPSIDPVRGTMEAGPRLSLTFNLRASW